MPLISVRVVIKEQNWYPVLIWNWVARKKYPPTPKFGTQQVLTPPAATLMKSALKNHELGTIWVYHAQMKVTELLVLFTMKYLSRI